jgi:NAD(P)H-dependent flavin oxidoreductase YrpB (nitropropane dioxygenase family)
LTKSTLSDLGVTLPVLAAPMAGGPTTPALVIAAAKAGSLGFLAAGYQTPEAFAAELAQVRSAGVPFAVNLFAPNPVPIAPKVFRDYAHRIRGDADRYGVRLREDVFEDEDAWTAKIDMLLADPVPIVSFTFGIPAPNVVGALRRAGTRVVQTVTSAKEARVAVDAGVDALAVQSAAAGGHSSTLTPEQPPRLTPATDLIAQVLATESVPLFAAGGLATPAEVAAVLGAGASAALVGTVLLLTDESGASATHKAAIAAGGRDTVVTRAFTGRPARGLRNEFIERYQAIAPLGYPAIHHLTSPMRKAAAAAGDPERVHLWAGTGYRNATAEPVATVLTRLAEHSA